jgi:putative acetyltransferase
LLYTNNKLDALYIDPIHFRKGLGKKLVKQAIEDKDINTVDVNEQSNENIAFFTDLGFVTLSTTPIDGFGLPYPIAHMHLKKVASKKPFNEDGNNGKFTGGVR